ncbi:MAG: hypothetical protein GY862_39270, partial [Gammaproteobacteria bacterium]|nr:hypothetical protein [Gammaproteobacteria bacterium]
GDLISGRRTDAEEINLEYANWKRTVEPFASYFPFIVGFGNHETLIHNFINDSIDIEIDKFPFLTHSSERVFADNFVNFENGHVEHSKKT